MGAAVADRQPRDDGRPGSERIYVGKFLFTALAMVAEFEADLARMRAREGMKVAKAKGRPRGKQPKPNARQEAQLVALHAAGEHASTELAELFGLARSTVYRVLKRAATGIAGRRSVTA